MKKPLSFLRGVWRETPPVNRLAILLCLVFLAAAPISPGGPAILGQNQVRTPPVAMPCRTCDGESGGGDAVSSATARNATPGITVEPFGTLGDEPVNLYTMVNTNGMKVAILSLGGIIQSIWVPDAFGNLANVVLGFPDLQGYLDHSDQHFGGIIGRYANRIAGGTFTLDGVTYRSPQNDGTNSIHGGAVGFDGHIWRVEELHDAGMAAGLRLHRLSPDGEEGYPGNLQVQVTYALSSENALSIRYQASTDAATGINLTNHSYFNLAGEGSGDVYGHVVQISAGAYTPLDMNLTPTGSIEAVAGTPFDFTEPTPIGRHVRTDVAQVRLAHGIDHNFVLDRAGPPGQSLELAVTVHEPVSGRTLRCFTTEPGIQFYTGNFLKGVFGGSSSRCYRQGDAMCLETQHFTDSLNHTNFPSTVLRPDDVFDSTTVYQFSV